MSYDKNRLERRVTEIKNELNKAHDGMTMSEVGKLQELQEELHWTEKKLKELEDDSKNN